MTKSHIHCFFFAQLLLILIAICLIKQTPYVANSFQLPPPALISRHRQTSTTVFRSSNNDDDHEYDLAVIGAGPVGVKAAILASSGFKKKVVLIDAPRASGVLMNEATKQDLSIGGPTGLFSKALRDVSKRIRVDSLRGMGLREESVWNEIISSCVDLATLNSDDVFRQLKYANVTYMEGFASFANSDNSKELLVTYSDSSGEDSKESVRVVKSEKILLATGSKPFKPDGIPFDGTRVFDSDTINQLSYLPTSIAITGSGIIAIEFAKIFRNLGADVTLIIRDRIPRNALMKIGLDKDIAATLVADLARSGIKIEKGAQVKSFDVPPTISESSIRAPIKIELEKAGGGSRPTGCPTELRCDAYLAAVGRKPNTFNLNLEGAGIEVDSYGGLIVNSDLCTTAKDSNVYGAGDVLGRPFLASTGVAQAAAVVEGMYRGKARSNCEVDTEALENMEATNDSPESDEMCIDGDLSSTGEKFDPKSLATNPFAFPTGVWSSPEAAFYGLSTQQAEELGIDAGEGIALYAECLRGLVFNPNGLLKIVYEKPAGRILGVHICGDDACELIHYGMELVKAKRTVNDLVDTLYSAVTYHEMYRIAAVAAIDQAGARKRRRAAGAALAARNRSIKQK